MSHREEGGVIYLEKSSLPWSYEERNSLQSCVQIVSHLRQYIAQVRAALSLLAREQPVCNKFLPPSVIAAGSRCNFSDGEGRISWPRWLSG